MKTVVTDTMLMPTYASRFSCIGGDCEDTCCAGWGITIDMESYLRYQASFDPVLRPLFNRYVKRYPKSKSSTDFGHIELLKDACHSCALLSEKKLCRIQERLGEEALSDTCANYPRTIHRLGDLHQMTLALSCPEAARLALLEKDAFGFVGKEQTVSLGFIAAVKPKWGLTLVAMEDVRTLLFQILRSQEISLSNRLKVIGSFCERLNDLIRARQPDALPALLLKMEADLESGDAMAPFQGLAELPDVQAQIAAPFLLAGGKSFQSPHVRKVLDEVSRGLGFQGRLAPEGPDLVQAYELGLRRLAPALEAVPWLLEHYLANEFLRELFPWKPENPKAHFATLVTRFTIVRLMLAGRAAAREALLTPVELAETVQVACRRYIHDTEFTKKADRCLVEAGWDTMERLFALL